jgi:hypothetical protein
VTTEQITPDDLTTELVAELGRKTCPVTGLPMNYRRPRSFSIGQTMWVWVLCSQCGGSHLFRIADDAGQTILSLEKAE